jgi:predicted ATPase
MELIGRERELGRLERALDEVRAGATRAVAIVGEAGIGKSALLAAARYIDDTRAIVRPRTPFYDLRMNPGR